MCVLYVCAAVALEAFLFLFLLFPQSPLRFPSLGHDGEQLLKTERAISDAGQVSLERASRISAFGLRRWVGAGEGSFCK